MKTKKKNRSSCEGNRSSLARRPDSSLERHQAHCLICRHPRREEIEEDFLNWTSPREIVQTYKISSVRAIYRHANAVALFERRRSNIERATDRIIERVSEVDVTAGAVIAAIRITLNEERKWLDRVHQLIQEDFRDDPPPSAPAQGNFAEARPLGITGGSAPALPTGTTGGTELAKTASEQENVEQKESAEEKPVAKNSSVVTDSASTDADRGSAALTGRGDSAGREGTSGSATAARATAKPAATAPKATRTVEKGPGTRMESGRARGQVAGLPWPWPAKRVTFVDRRPWKRPVVS